MVLALIFNSLIHFVLILGGDYIFLTSKLYLLLGYSQLTMLW